MDCASTCMRAWMDTATGEKKAMMTKKAIHATPSRSLRSHMRHLAHAYMSSVHLCLNNLQLPMTWQTQQDDSLHASPSWALVHGSTRPATCQPATLEAVYTKLHMDAQASIA